MIAAIYARKSTDQSGVADEAKSVTRQIAHAREYATRKGWTVDDAHVYVDDGISGAEFANRPGFVRLMNALKPRPAFQVLVMSEESRLGREAIETAYALKQLITSGVRVFFYLEDRERTLDSPTDKIMLSLTAYADELEREKARQRVTDAMVRKARAGHVTGGRVFGYDNLEILDANGRRSHVERRINEPEAAVVRRIFDLAAEGTGYTRIAKGLNADHVPSPRPQQGRPAGWCPSSVRAIIHSELYRGVVVWNRTKKRDRWGQHRQADRPPAQWMRHAAPELRIISDAIWHATHARLTGIRTHLTRMAAGRAGHARDIDSAYLLAGFARCGGCGGALGVVSRQSGGRRHYFYGCLVYNKRGPHVCNNRLVLPIERVDAAVLATVAEDVLRPAVVEAVIAGVLDALEPRAQPAEAKRRRADLLALDRELEHLTAAVAAGGALAPLVVAIQARQAQREQVIAAIAAAEVQTTGFNRRHVERQIRQKLADWRGLLTQHVPEGRELLRHILVGPMRFTPDGKSYRFEGHAAVGRLFLGIVGLPTCGASLNGSGELGSGPFVGIAA